MVNKLLEIYENVKRIDTNNKIMPFIKLGIVVSIIIFIGMLSVLKSLFVDFTINSIPGILLIISMIVFEVHTVYAMYEELIMGIDIK